MNHKTSVLVVDDNLAFARIIARKLHALDMPATLASCGREALAILDKTPFDAVLTDITMPELDGLELMRQVRKKHPQQDFYFMTGAGTLDAAIAALQLGARDFLLKPFPLERLNTLFGPLRSPEAQFAASDWRSRHAPEILGTDPALLAMLEVVQRVADTMSSVLILGQSGTGKELVARAIHRASGRAGAFIPMNCAAIPRELIESELFGHAKGAFTGAHSERMGRFAAAEGGTLFLDEVGEMSLEAQAKILRVLQEREYTPVGSNEVRRSNVRIVAATNRPLKEEVAAQRFREDLYFRLNVVTVQTPPLRDRTRDIPLLLETSLERVNRAANRKVMGFTQEALALLQAHRWPGNVRELENTVERLVVMRGAGEIDADDVRGVLGNDPEPERAPERVQAPRLSESGLDLKASLELYEDDLVSHAMSLAGGNQTRAADLLHINRTTLIEKLRRQRQRQQHS
jgi:DNA-binding NtrC family response regulator